MPPAVRIRRDITAMAPDDPIIRFYREAIRVMKTRPLNVSTSWRYQAAIHDYPRDVSTRESRLNDPINPDPLADVRDVIPPDHTTFWRKCEHGGWFFLPWHRMYLHHFEKIVMDIVAGLPGGISDWALPYWNYNASPAAALLPAPFRDSTFNGVANDLFVAQRTPNANLGQPFLRPTDISLTALRTTPFANVLGGPTISNHDPGSSGRLEASPHNGVHGQLGGPTGFMGGFSTAPLDPMFWLHHCNIDRLWEVWVQRQKQLGNLDRNPKPGALPGERWVNTQVFDFRDANGTAVPMTSREVLNTRAAPLSYEYEDTSDPFNGA